MFKLKDIMKTKVITVKRDTPIYEAVAAMVENNITGLPVVNDDSTLVGILSEKDVLTLLYNIEDINASVEDFMTADPISFDAQDSIIDVTDCLTKNHFRRVPVLKKGKLAGIISRKDIIEYILRIRRDGKLKSSLQTVHSHQK